MILTGTELQTVPGDVSGNYIDHGLEAFDSQGTFSFLWRLRLTPGALGSSSLELYCGDSSGISFFLTVNTNAANLPANTIDFTINDPAGHNASAANAAFTFNTDHTVAMVYAAGVTRLYVDGTLRATINQIPPFPTVAPEVAMDFDATVSDDAWIIKRVALLPGFFIAFP